MSAPTSADLLVVYTDGACSGNPGPGGWGWATLTGIEGSGSEAQSTNQRMEVWAVLDALQTLLVRHGGPIRVVSDSTYVVNCFRDGWWKGWLTRGWKNSQKQPVANQDLWKPLVTLYRDAMSTPLGPDRVTFQWVKGHSGNPMNDRVDELAVAAARSQSERTITGLPNDDPAEAIPQPYVHVVDVPNQTTQTDDVKLITEPESLRLF
jgi:ribonuclease HI